ncbi:MAG: 3-deoxy-manno-octulosonate cytidylyltransferase [Bacteroidales bacterium]|jgi:3-deoxy-manno-octulosonate cytidylyltransferase (CMP-KDO synthetase)|nr:3-deoxy-manno-octulosonate cytidylyltransferase [Bacteroidales bacterium]
MDAIVIIPARYASTRFPGKPLVKIGNKSMIQRVYEQAQSVVNAVWVATDDQRIQAEVEQFGGSCIITSDTHTSGTDRLAEAVTKIPNGNAYDVVINVQGDEPFIHAEQIQQLIDLFEDETTQIATLIKPITHSGDIWNPNKPKVVIGNQQQALYFSRSPIPYMRGIDENQWIEQHQYFKHIGIYAYRPQVLCTLTQLARTPLEIAESLEQLRWLEHGYCIQTAVTDYESLAVDTPEDLEYILQNLEF